MRCDVVATDGEDGDVVFLIGGAETGERVSDVLYVGAVVTDEAEEIGSVPVKIIEGDDA